MHIITKCERFEEGRPLGKLIMNEAWINYTHKCFEALWNLENGPVQDQINNDQEELDNNKTRNRNRPKKK